MLRQNKRESYVDFIYDSDCSQENYSNKLFIRLVARKRRFENVDFKYSIFDTSYLRDCVFDSCDFTGCRFISVNFYGSSFHGCTFDYATFERTIIDSDILSTGCPGWDNLKLKFARTLRMNFQQIGDTKSVNKAIRIELSATEVHLHKAWSSNESYYRKKYAGLKRVHVFFEWVLFKLLDLIWGNGENTLKLIRNTAVVLLLMSFVDFFAWNSCPTKTYLDSLINMPAVFLGVVSPASYPPLYLSLIVFIRLIIIGFFLSIIIKRFNRR